MDTIDRKLASWPEDVQVRMRQLRSKYPVIFRGYMLALLANRENQICNARDLTDGQCDPGQFVKVLAALNLGKSEGKIGPGRILIKSPLGIGDPAEAFAKLETPGAFSTSALGNIDPFGFLEKRRGRGITSPIPSSGSGEFARANSNREAGGQAKNEPQSPSPGKRVKKKKAGFHITKADRQYLLTLARLVVTVGGPIQRLNKIFFRLGMVGLRNHSSELQENGLLQRSGSQTVGASFDLTERGWQIVGGRENIQPLSQEEQDIAFAEEETPAVEASQEEPPAAGMAEIKAAILASFSDPSVAKRLIAGKTLRIRLVGNSLEIDPN